MKKNFLLAIFALLFITWSCSDTKDKKSTDDDTKETGKKKKTTDDEESTDETSSDDESNGGVQSSPENVVRAIFKAAKSEDYSILSGLCAGDADGDTKDICDIENNTDKQEEFKDYFSKGKIVGESEIEGNEARVNFKFGADGDQEETMVLTKKGKKWYLSSF